MTQDNEKEPKSGTGSKVAIGTIVLGVIGLLTAFFNQGGIELLKTFWKPTTSPPEVLSSSPAPSINPSPIPSTILASPSPSATVAISPTPVPINSPNKAPIQVITAKEFIFELKECKRASEAIKCEIDIINKTKDRGLRIYGNGSYQSSLTDLQGKQYLAKYVDFGAAQNNQYVDQNLVQDIRLKAYVTFDAIPPEVKQVQLVEFTAQSGELFPVRFRGVSIAD